MSTPAAEQQLRRVCVWLGEHKIIDHVADPVKAQWFEERIQRRYASLRVTNEAAEVDQ